MILQKNVNIFISILNNLSKVKKHSACSEQLKFIRIRNFRESLNSLNKVPKLFQ